MAAVWIYITVPGEEEAQRIGQALVEDKLAACVNILPGMRSIYRWQGAIDTAEETVLIAKSTGDLVAQLTERVKSLHSYSCPCVVALPIADGNADFLSWIETETRRQR